MTEQIRQLEIGKLLLDPDNPRLPTDIDKNNQSAIIDYIARRTSIEELMSAIGGNGFFEGEPLIVYRNDRDAEGKFRVIEGNRRLTAVMLLSQPDLCPSRKAIAETAREAKHKPTKLPVIKVSDRLSSLPYLGSRHIAGVKQWEPLSKARYMLQLHESFTNSNDLPEIRYKEVAKRIGSRADFIRRNLEALAVYKVIEENSFFEIDDLNEETISFSVLSTAIAYPSIGDFVGVGEIKNEEYNHYDVTKEPQSLKEVEIQLLSRWCFEKDDDGSTKLGDSRNLKMLARVIATPKALESFKNGADLKYAYAQTRGIDDEFAAFMERAKNELREASAIMANTSSEQSHYDLAQDVFDISRTIRNAIRDKVNPEDD